jgi:uncharacterized membrane protein
VDLQRASVDDMALVYRSDSGKVKIQQTRDLGAGKGALRGGGLGLLLGLFAPPVGIATVAGGAIGALASGIGDKGIDNKLMKRVGEHIDGANAAVFILADDASISHLSSSDDLAEQETEYVVVAGEIQELIQDVNGLEKTAYTPRPTETWTSE